MTTQPAGFPKANAAARLEAYLYDAIPLVAAMQVKIHRLDHQALSLSAPLMPNRNHIGTAFGGSLQGLATLACWGVVWLLFDGMPSHIVVQESHMRFTNPARQTFVASCQFPDNQIIQRCHSTWQQRGKARLSLTAELDSAGQSVGHYQGRFVALRATE